MPSFLLLGVGSGSLDAVNGGVPSAPETGARVKAKRRSGRRAKEKADARAAGDGGGSGDVSRVESFAAVLTPVAVPIIGSEAGGGACAGPLQTAFLALPMEPLDEFLLGEALHAASSGPLASAAAGAAAGTVADAPAAAAPAAEGTGGTGLSGTSGCAPLAPPTEGDFPAVLRSGPPAEDVGLPEASADAAADKGENAGAEEAAFVGCEDCVLHEVLALLQMGSAQAAAAATPAPTTGGGIVFMPPSLAPSPSSGAGAGGGSVADGGTVWGQAAALPQGPAGRLEMGSTGMIVGAGVSAAVPRLPEGPYARSVAARGPFPALPVTAGPEGDTLAAAQMDVQPPEAGGLGAADSWRMEGEFICPITQVGFYLKVCQDASLFENIQ